MSFLDRNGRSYKELRRRNSRIEEITKKLEQGIADSLSREGPNVHDQYFIAQIPQGNIPKGMAKEDTVRRVGREIDRWLGERAAYATSPLHQLIGFDAVLSTMPRDELLQQVPEVAHRLEQHAVPEEDVIIIFRRADAPQQHSAGTRQTA